MTRRLGTAMTVLVSCVAGLALVASAQTVVDDMALADESDGRNWLGYGRTYSEKRFSPLVEIDTKTVCHGRAHVVPPPASPPRSRSSST